MTSPPLIQAVARAAAAWRDPEHPPRAKAAKATLQRENAFTEEAVAFAVNQQMALLKPQALAAWVGGRTSEVSLAVGVMHGGDVPLQGVQDLLAVVLTGHRYVGAVAPTSPALLPAFADEVRRHAPGLPVTFTRADVLFDQADVCIADVDEETHEELEARCEAHGIPPERRLLRGRRYGVAVIDGQEPVEERERLAEDALLHEGLSRRNVALVWAPQGLSPDPYLDAFAAFRGVFPAHPSTPGRLRMQQAFLEATGVPTAYGEGLEFLLSKGEPDVQAPGHVRWSEYARLGDVAAWLGAHASEIELVAARPALARRLPSSLPTQPLGEAHRPALGWCSGGRDIVAFLRKLGEEG